MVAWIADFDFLNFRGDDGFKKKKRQVEMEN